MNLLSLPSAVFAYSPRKLHPISTPSALVFLHSVLTSTASFSSLPYPPSGLWIVLFPSSQHGPVSSAMDDPQDLPFPIEHDWSDIDPDPPDSESTDMSVALSSPDSVF